MKFTAHVDMNGDKLVHYIKAVEFEGESFFYVIQCIESSGSETKLLPILIFPTRDGDLIAHYRKGELISAK